MFELMTCGGMTLDISLVVQKRDLPGRKWSECLVPYSPEHHRVWNKYIPRMQEIIARRYADQARRERKNKATLKAVTPPKDDSFWSLITLAHKSSTTSGPAFRKALATALASLGKQRTKLFHRELLAQVKRANLWDLWAAAYLINGGCSDDGFLYFRAWLVAQGQDIFEKAIANADSLADGGWAFARGEHEMEELLSVADDALEMLDSPADLADPQGGAPKGKRFDPDDKAGLRTRLPRLAAKHLKG